MESTCLRPCTQVNVLKRMIVFKKKIVRSPTLLLLSPTKTDGWKMILFVGESTLFCKLFLITTSYLKRLKTSLYRPLLLQPINVPFEIPYPFKFPFNLSLWYNIYYLFDSRRMLLLKWAPSCPTLAAPSVSTWESHYTPLWKLATLFLQEQKLGPSGLDKQALFEINRETCDRRPFLVSSCIDCQAQDDF